MDLRLIPMLALLYLLSFLDRGNIGNAKIAGMQDDLSLSGHQYSLCAVRLCCLINFSISLTPLDGVLLHLLRFRDPVESPAQALKTFSLASGHHGSMGNGHDAHGAGNQLPRTAHCSHLPWCS